MNKKLKKLLLVLPALCLFSCNKSEVNECEQLLSGKHELRKFNVKTANKTESSGCWFLAVGSYNSSTEEESKIRFYFKAVNNEYIFKEMDFSKVNIRIDSTVKIPYVKFYWRRYGTVSGYKIYEEAITRAVIYCRESDFQPEININNIMEK